MKLIWENLYFDRIKFFQRILQPFALKSLILSFGEDSEATTFEQYWYAAAVSLSTLGTTLVWHPVLFQFFRVGMKCRIACSALIYRKVGKISNETTRNNLVSY